MVISDCLGHELEQGRLDIEVDMMLEITNRKQTQLSSLGTVRRRHPSRPAKHLGGAWTNAFQSTIGARAGQGFLKDLFLSACCSKAQPR